MAENTFSDLGRLIEQLGKDKGIDRTVVIDAIEQGMELAARKKFGTYREIEAKYNDEVGEVELFEFKEVKGIKVYIDGKETHSMGKDNLKIPSVLARSSFRKVIFL